MWQSKTSQSDRTNEASVFIAWQMKNYIEQQTHAAFEQNAVTIKRKRFNANLFIYCDSRNCVWTASRRIAVVASLPSPHFVHASLFIQKSIIHFACQDSNWTYTCWREEKSSWQAWKHTYTNTRIDMCACVSARPFYFSRTVPVCTTALLYMGNRKVH